MKSPSVLRYLVHNGTDNVPHDWRVDNEISEWALVTVPEAECVQPPPGLLVHADAFPAVCNTRPTPHCSPPDLLPGL